ncbi:MFS general substrate transporter [Microthyrium microscopicum]|uniref:MFS general substrate transporter n=1 Tax=Microthyrium microscopicum TaxID=703497 RepID=A0A6A6U893_9PEZI|nr:MFS general substrate transporter [Microthyrium microscopicum]
MADPRLSLSSKSFDEAPKDKEHGLDAVEDYDEESALPRVVTRDAEKIERIRTPLERLEVKWKDNDPENPYNWSTKKKSWITFQLGMLALAGSAASAIIAPGEDQIAKEFNISGEATVLTISLYVTGFIIGPSIWAPISELWGRRVSLLPAVLCLALLSVGTGASKSTASIMITRLLGGIFGAAPVSNVAAALGDIWTAKVRGTAMSLYAIAVVGGPTLAPVLGGALTQTVSWRWTEYVQAIFTFVVFVLCCFCLPEVYAPYLLRKRAEKLRKETGDSRWYHPHEALHKEMTFKAVVTKHFARPVKMLLTEPMVTCIALYASFVFGILYMTLQFFPIVYHQNRGWSLLNSCLPFAALFVGVLAALGINLSNQPRYARAVEKAGGKPVPEARLPPMALGGFIFVIGLFVFGWTADPSIPWPVSVVAAGFIGAGFNTIFQQCINFLVDTYRVYAASATSANTLLRSVLAAALPFAAAPMFNRLGPGVSMSILGAIAALALPVPFVFMKYGPALRRMSKFAPVDE